MYPGRRKIQRAAWALLAALLPLGCGDDEKSSPPEKPFQPSICERDADCKSGRCDPLQGCVQCLFDRDCKSGERCDQEHCRAVIPCDTAQDCSAARPACDAKENDCVECLQDKDCGKSAHCKAQHCEAIIPCSTTAPCPNDWVCDRQNNECVHCVVDADCGSGERCVAAECRKACKSDAECPSVYHCSETVCALDVCEAGKRCDEKNLEIISCNSSGSAVIKTACKDEQSCAMGDAGARCEDWLCKPSEWACDSGGQRAEHCSDDGLEVSKSVDCAAKGELCRAGQCKKESCEPGALTCDGAELRRCNEEGTSLVLKKTCADDERCDADAGECQHLLCAPNTSDCDGAALRSCNADGSDYEIVDCAAQNAVCRDGACRAIVCAGPQCDGNVLYSCEDEGTRLAVAQDCAQEGSFGGICDPQTNKCRAYACEIAKPLCDGNIAAVCADDGFGPGDGIDCGSQACWEGDCLDRVCSGDYACGDDGNVYTCSNGGTALEPRATCAEGYRCNAERGECEPAPCEPNRPLCLGETATVCASDGSGPKPGGRACDQSDQVCVSGECLPVICKPGDHRCEGGNVTECDPKGATYRVSDICTTNEYCADSADHCLIQECSPGAAYCVGDIKATCNSNGSGPTPGGVDCTQQGALCVLGQCRDVTCHPNELFCQQGHVVHCNEGGTDAAPYDNCELGQHCEPGNATAACLADICNDGGPACEGEITGVCNADGGGFQTLSTDCAKSGKVCDLQAGCTATARDTLGGNDQQILSPSPAIYLNLIESTVSRTLTELQTQLSLPSSTTLTWLIYEEGASEASYELSYSKTTTGAGSGTVASQSSGAIGFRLAAGHHYAVGVHIAGPHTAFAGGAQLPAFVSFGRVTGRYGAISVSAVPQGVEVLYSYETGSELVVFSGG